MPVTYCADPFQKHKTKCRKRLWKVSKKLIDDVNDPRLKDGDFLCITCKIQLIKNPKCLSAQNQDSSSSASQEAASSVQDKSESTVNTSLSDAEVSREVTESVLPLIGVSPLTSSKCKFYLIVFLSYLFC